MVNKKQWEEYKKEKEQGKNKVIPLDTMYSKKSLFALGGICAITVLFLSIW